MRRDRLTAFAASLPATDEVVVEATGNAAAVAEVIGRHLKRVVIANPKQVRIIAHAKIKTDTIDAGVLVQLYASGFLPEVWIADEPTQALRRQVTRRNQIVRRRTRLKNIMQSILHAHLIPACPHQDLCAPKGRAWLSEQVLPTDERRAIERHLREFDRLGEDLQAVECALARSALTDERVARLITIPGIDMVVALAIVAAVGGRALRQPAEARQLSRPQSERPAIGTGARPSWADHQAGTRSRPRHAGGGGVGGAARAGPVARLLSARARPARSACRRGRDRPHAGRSPSA
jgi:transposase